MEIAKTYDPKSVEGKWYKHWMDKKYFHSEPDEREPFTIVIPPPNVTGVLHMGHMLNNTIQDVLTRKARLQGYNACWVPGTDHASIATEAKVVRMLREKNIKKGDLSREEFLKHAWEWTDKYGGTILEQLKKLGASCDWDRTRFTMEDKLSKAVIEVFVDLYNKGYIYRGLRMVNWDPAAKTALSDEEVIHKETISRLHHLRYRIEGTEDEYITIATTRPETILGDTAICVHPDDDRYKHLVGKKALVPLINRAIPIIADEYVEREFGTGALKVTPAHDVNDYELGKKHNLETIDILNDDGTLNTAAQLYIGFDRFEARKAIIKDLDDAKHLVKIEDLPNKVGYSERTSVVIEPKLSMQWFLDMKKLGGPALENVMNDNIKFYPSKFKNTYRHWMENIKDWCISRQLWWGQQVPAFYFGEGENDYVVAKTIEEALELAKKKSNNQQLTTNNLKQDEDVVDTWFSSWLWPISVFDGFENPDNKDIQYYYPTSVLVTAPDIIFFWVARMIMAGYEYKNEKPFDEVYFTGVVRDLQGRKMSKSLGNSPEPLDLIDQYGADGVRVGMLYSSPAGNDLLFDEKLCEQGRNFSNKIWNAMRLIKGWEIYEGKNEENEISIQWFEHKFNQVLEQLERAFKNYNLSEALKTLYNFVWDDFCSWYLEMIKPEYEKPIDRYTFNKTVEFFEKNLILLHPFMPFITEEIWHLLKERADGDDIVIAKWPVAKAADESIIEKGEIAKDIISKVREIRNKKNLKQREPLPLFVQNSNKSAYADFQQLIIKLAYLDHFRYTDTEIEDAITFISNKDKFYVTLEQEINVEEEKERLQKELDYAKGFIRSVEGKLKNEKFVNNAPEAVVANEKQKLQDGLDKIKALEEALARLN